MKFCEHIYEYKSSYCPGLVYYGKVLVYGIHDNYVCKWCGKSKWKIYGRRRGIKKLYSQKELEEYHKKIGYVKPPLQLEFI